MSFEIVKSDRLLGFPWARPHDLRHVFCSHLLNTLRAYNGETLTSP